MRNGTLSREDFTVMMGRGGIDLPRTFQRTGRATKQDVSGQYVPRIPLAWAIRAIALPGKAWGVGCLLWYRARVSGSTTVTLTRAWLQEFGVDPETARRGLRQLEAAGLVCVERRGKRSPQVTLIEGQEGSDVGL
jgi:hypothetical protein